MTRIKRVMTRQEKVDATPATRARATERTILLLALAICRTAFAIGYFGVSYRGLAILMGFVATAVMFFAALACIIIQFVIPLLKDIVGRKR